MQYITAKASYTSYEEQENYEQFLKNAKVIFAVE